MEKEEKESTFSKLRENATKFYETTGSPLILQKVQNVQIWQCY